MLVLGIDPGTATTGYGFVRDVDDGPVAVAYGVILTPAGAAMPLRLLTIYRELKQLIALHRPDTGAGVPPVDQFAVDVQHRAVIGAQTRVTETR